MPRNYNEKQEKFRHGSPTMSPKRRKRSRSREKNARSPDRRRSPGEQNNHTYRTNRRLNHDNKNRRPTDNSHKFEEGRWGKNGSSSDNDENRENLRIEQEKRKSRDMFKSRQDTSKHDRKADRPNNPTRFDVANEHEENKCKLVQENEEEKQGPNMALSGKLMEDTNTFNGVTVKYSEPQEAKKPKRRWRFYVFKGEEAMPVLHLHRQSAYLMGKDRKVADIPIDHPSCSRQHAVLQYRCLPGKTADGQKITRTLPYIIDLDSSNGTFLNNKKIEPKRYVELREKDVLKFGFSSREYVLLHDQSDHEDESE